MNRSNVFVCWSVLLSFNCFLLAGCGLSGANFPEASVNPQQASLGSIQGNDFGGHAPLVGARIFVMQLGVSGYGSKASSLLSSTSTDTTGTATTNPTYGLSYVLSDSTGSFNITGDYTCTVGYPVWVMGVGGSPTYPSASNVFQSSSVLVTATQGSGSSETATYTLTTTTQQNFYVGEQVVFTNYQGGFAGGDGLTANVLAAGLTTTTFSVTAADPNDEYPAGNTYPAPGTVTAMPTNNPAAVNMAMLGNCPDGTTDVGFKNTIKFIYMNEVSTAAAAYAMAGFASTTANNDALHIGIPAGDALALTGAANAALNAGNLYDITGGNLTSGYAGEGHIARAVTKAGNGTVPQAELDTLGNILASCVDSNNTYSSYANPTGTQSSECTGLFAAATSTGTSAGTRSADTATAVMNIAHNPGASSILGLYNMPTGNVPFAPYLSTTAAPNDFTVGVVYNNIANPTGIAIDAGGDAYVPTSSTTASYVTRLSPQGAVLNTSAAGGNGFNFAAIDKSGNVWVTAGGSNEVYAFSSTLGTVTGSPFGAALLNTPTAVAADNAGYVYVTDGGNSSSIVQKFTTAGLLNASITNNCMTRISGVTLDATGYIWAVINSSNNICRVSNTGGTSSFSTGGQPNGPTNVAIDSSGNGWASAGAQTNLYKITSTGTETSYGVINNNAVGGLSSPTWVAVDGAENVWVANKGNGFALSEFNSAGIAITGTAGYQNGNLNSPSSLAIDGSGDVWVPNGATSGTNANTVTELIGAGFPVVTPLSAQKPGVAP